MPEIHYRDQEGPGSALARAGSGFANSAVALQRLRQQQQQAQLQQYYRNMQNSMEQQRFDLDRQKFDMAKQKFEAGATRENLLMDSAKQISEAIAKVNRGKYGVGPLTEDEEALQSAIKLATQITAMEKGGVEKLMQRPPVAPGHSQYGPFATMGGSTNPVFTAPNPVGEARNAQMAQSATNRQDMAEKEFTRKTTNDAETVRYHDALIKAKGGDSDLAQQVKQATATKRAEEEHNKQIGMFGRVKEYFGGRQAMPQQQSMTNGPMQAPQQQSTNILQQAQDAIQRGADPAKVKARLKQQYGIDMP